MYFSSDPQALSGFTENSIFLDEGDVVHVQQHDFLIRSAGQLVDRPIHRVDVTTLTSDKGDYPHFMLKEIYEQPEVMRSVWKGRIDFTTKRLHAAAFAEIDSQTINTIVCIACGTASYAGQLGAIRMEQLAHIPARKEIASEFMYKYEHVTPGTLYMFISQSGETKDSIESLEKIQAQGGRSCGIINVVGSSLARQTDFGFYTRA